MVTTILLNVVGVDADGLNLRSKAKVPGKMWEGGGGDQEAVVVFLGGYHCQGIVDKGQLGSTKVRSLCFKSFVFACWEIAAVGCSRCRCNPHTCFRSSPDSIPYARRADSFMPPLNCTAPTRRVARDFVDALYAPRPVSAFARDDTLLCRCESVTFGDVRRVVRLGATGPNRVKTATRCGMGPCQGRMCGGNLTRLIAEETGTPPEAVGAFRIRPPLKPILLGDYAALAADDAA